MREIHTASGEGKAVVKLPRARKRERKNTLCSVVHKIVSRDVISEIHTRETTVSYVTHVRCVIGKLWGPSPKNTQWAYSSIIRPALTYGCHMWARAIADKSIASSLVRVNRLALMLLGNFRTKTPTAGLAVIIPPLHLFIEREAAMKFRQIQGHLRLLDAALKTTTLSKRGHRFIVCRGLLSKLGVAEQEMDEIPTTMVWNRHFKRRWIDPTQVAWIPSCYTLFRLSGCFTGGRTKFCKSLSWCWTPSLPLIRQHGTMSSTWDG